MDSELSPYMHVAAREKAVGHINLWHLGMEGVNDDLLVEVGKLSKRTLVLDKSAT